MTSGVPVRAASVGRVTFVCPVAGEGSSLASELYAIGDGGADVAIGLSADLVDAGRQFELKGPVGGNGGGSRGGS